MSGGLGKLKADLRTDSKRAWILAILVTVLLVLWGRLILGGPRFGIASVLPQAAPAPSETLGSAHPERHGAMGLSLAQWAQEPVKVTPRNFFLVPYEDYPLDPNHPAQTSQKAGDQGKSGTLSADQNKERQKLVEALREQAATLALESTMPGTHPKAWINGVLVGVGEPIGQTGFTVVKVETRRIFIEQNGIQIELSMKQ